MKPNQINSPSTREDKDANLYRLSVDPSRVKPFLDVIAFLSMSELGIGILILTALLVMSTLEQDMMQGR